jgi:inhibitor of cysteine peptidase
MVTIRKTYFWICSILFVITTTACSQGGDIKMPEIGRLLPIINSAPENFESCQELDQWHNSRLAEWNSLNERYWKWYESVNPTMPLVYDYSPISPPSVTNVQLRNVDEPDVVKAQGKDLFQARSQSVEWIDINSMKVRQTLNFPGDSDIKLFLEGDRLLVLSSGDTRSNATLFERKGQKLNKILEFSVSGYYIDARMVEGQVILITQDYLDTFISTQGKTFNEVPCGEIGRPVIDDYSFLVTSIHRLRLTSQTPEFHSGAYLGGAQQIFMTEQHLYIFDNGYQWFHWDPRLDFDELFHLATIVNFDLALDKNPVYKSVGTLSGFIRDQFSISEDKTGKNLFVVTTESGFDGLSNRLWTLADTGSDLEVVGLSDPFGIHEDVRAVRFIDHRAYVVTFEKTDPLFVFDLSSPREPKLLSRLEVPGFSAYLHPVGGDRLLGIGYGATADDGFSWLGGIQFSMFRLHPDGDVSAEEQINFGARGSHVDAGRDHHAFLFDPDTNLAMVPLRILTTETELEFSGAYLLDLNRGLSPVAKISHYDFIPETCRQTMSQFSWWTWASESMDIRRVIRLDDEYVSISPFGVQVHGRNGSAIKRRELIFADAEAECTRLTRRWSAPGFD